MVEPPFRPTPSTACSRPRPRWPSRLVVAALAALAVLAPAAAQPSPDEELSFVVVGHLRGPRTNEPFYLMEELLDRIAALGPDAVFLTGDLIFGDWLEERVDASRIVGHWERLDASLERLGVPVYRVPGNHDINDPITRDIWFDRYGVPPQAVTLGGNRFLLLATPYIPVGTDPPETPRPFARVADLPAAQVEFVRKELESYERYDNIFLFMHHVVWWTPERAWWSEVHPLLVGRRVRAVFAGDYGPLMFSHLRRDGIDYLQSALEWKAPAHLLRSELGRLMNYQFDTFVHVHVAGRGEVDIEVEVLGATSSGKYSPERFQELFGSERTTRPSLVKRFLASRRMTTAAALAIGVVIGAAALWLPRRWLA